MINICAAIPEIPRQDLSIFSGGKNDLSQLLRVFGADLPFSKSLLVLIMGREKGKGKFKKENKERQKKKKTNALAKDDMQWLASNTNYDKENISEWHRVGIVKACTC